MEKKIGVCCSCGFSIFESDRVFGCENLYKCLDCGAYNNVESEE